MHFLLNEKIITFFCALWLQEKQDAFSIITNVAGKGREFVRPSISTPAYFGMIVSIFLLEV